MLGSAPSHSLHSFVSEPVHLVWGTSASRTQRRNDHDLESHTAGFLIAGILILVMPRLLNYIVALYLILIGLIGLFGVGTFNFK